MPITATPPKYINKLPLVPAHRLEPLFIRTLLDHIKLDDRGIILMPLADQGLMEGLANNNYNNTIAISPDWQAPDNEKFPVINPLEREFWKQFNTRGLEIDYIIVNTIPSPRWYRAIIMGAYAVLNTRPIKVCCLHPLGFLQPNIPHQKICFASCPEKIILPHPNPRDGAKTEPLSIPLCWTIYGNEPKAESTQLINATNWNGPITLEGMTLE